jgi:P4 family phage/plasmid primase-like protien
MINFTVYSADCVGNSGNCLYPNKNVVTDKESFIAATKMDHVTAKYKGNYRSKDNFESSDCIPLDCDNDHSENPEDWLTPFDIALSIPGVVFAASYSRHHNLPKGDKSARPRFHVFFPIPKVTDGEEYAAMKRKIADAFPYYDTNALDSARFLYGNDSDEVEFYEGDKTILDYLEEDDFADFDASLEQVPEGQRNSTMSHIAGKIIKRYGNTEDAYQIFLKKAERCNPPLPESELKVIWRSASKFGKKVSNQEGYIPPEQYNSDCRLKPEDFSDVGQATVLATEYKDILRYSPSTDYMVYNGSFWEESKPKSQGVSQDLTERQLAEAETEMKKAMDELVKNGGMEILVSVGSKKAVQMFNKQQAHAYEMYEDAVAYKKYAIKRRDTKNIAATLKEARPMLEVEQRNLDADEFMLNTPTLTYDLRQGTKYPLEHRPEHFITKQTTVDPSSDGADIWAAALDTFFLKDIDLIDYVQRMVGLSAIGKVYVEALIIAYGEGRNGKSTFWNVIARVLGTYSGNISADMLTVGCRRNVKPELAEAKGKRMLIAAELEEGMRLNTANVKQLCSTDEIYAEKKYKDPFSYTPTHTLVLYTNHLPKVGAIDKGTWRRLIVIPFDAKIEGSADIKNYADYLFEKAGGAILTWVIEGARKVIADNYKIDPPQKVRDAIEHYKESNDWLSYFLSERCELDPAYVAKSSEVYNEYRIFCTQVGEFTRSTTDFYTALETVGFERYRDRKGRYIKGLRLKTDFMEEE